MPRIAWWLVASIGLGVSALLLYEYVAPTGQLCGVDSGCDVVRLSAYASLVGVPTPAFGVAFFGAALAVAATPRLRAFVVPLAILGALASVAFLALQAFAIGAWCAFCLVADGAALALAALAVPVARSAETGIRWRVAGPAALVGFALPIACGMALRGDADLPPAGALPDVIAREQRPGVATIVEFLDFECPYCRRQHETMKRVVADYRDRVRMVYKHVPLPSHADAEGAARAACCAEEQDRLFELADALFAATDLSAAGCERIAQKLGLDMDAYRSCLRSERPAARLAADLEAAVQADVRGLPTFYIGRLRFEGLKEASLVRDAIERALTN